MAIKILDNSLINKIAAGEVVERPASVVKELLENSIDAGADKIKIEIEQAGIRKIKISDNGHGMNKDDLLLSYKRHATSKINNEDDLFNINSLGFRGEALASVAEISNLKIQTRDEFSDVGNFAEVEGGILKRIDVVGCSRGTIIEITDLFFNVPARKKYLKSYEIEFNHILKLVTKYALIKKNVSIKLIKDGKEVLNSRKTSSFLDNIIFVYGVEISKDLIPVEYSEDGVEIFGYISKPSLTRSDKADQSIYVNERFVKDNLISSAIYNAYRTLLFINRHPVFVLDIKINPKDIDVNVHPSKEIIKLKNEESISGVIHNAISDSFKKSNLIAGSNFESESSAKPSKSYEFQLDVQSNLDFEKKDKQTFLEVQESKEIYSKKPEKKVENNFGPFRVLGQINKTFIIAESKEGLVIIDQHAAEERVNYERFMEEKKNDAIKKQKLLTPKIVELNPYQYQAALNNKEFIENLGYEFDDFGENSVKLSGIPEIFGRLKSVLFIDIINELENKKGQIVSEEIEDRIVRFSCKASIKAGDELTGFEMRELLRKLENCNNPFTCPHGRPTIINLSIGDLEKKFKRTGW